MAHKGRMLERNIFGTIRAGKYYFASSNEILFARFTCGLCSVLLHVSKNIWGLQQVNSIGNIIIRSWLKRQNARGTVDK